MSKAKYSWVVQYGVVERDAVYCIVVSTKKQAEKARQEILAHPGLYHTWVSAVTRVRRCRGATE